MKIARHLLSVTVLLFVLITTNCGPPSKEEDTENRCPPPSTVKSNQTSQSFYTILADENLSEEHKVAILQSLNEWSDKTGNTLKYCLSFVDMSQDPPDVTTPHTIKVYERDPGPGYLGWTSWSSTEFSAYTFVRPGVDGDLFRRIMLHELGHAFNLSFDGNSHYLGSSQSMMHPSIRNEPTNLGCPELKSFCKNYGCEVECKDSTQLSAGLECPNILWKETRDGQPVHR